MATKNAKTTPDPLPPMRELIELDWFAERLTETRLMALYVHGAELGELAERANMLDSRNRTYFDQAGDIATNCRSAAYALIHAADEALASLEAIAKHK